MKTGQSYVLDTFNLNFFGFKQLSQLLFPIYLQELYINNTCVICFYKYLLKLYALQMKN